MEIFQLYQGTAPLLISLPHNGTAIPPAIRARMTVAGKRVADTDWHVARLYAFAMEVGASIIQPQHSRYVIDLNRPSDGQALYPGQRETGLVPTISFADEDIYQLGAEPDGAEIAERTRVFWTPYHDALAAEIGRLRTQHGRVVLWEGHSIRSHVPMLFDGRLPDLNLGTAQGASCDFQLQFRLASILQSQSRYTHALNGRFKGGYITRHYADREHGINAVQMEIAQCNYMDEDSFEYLPERAAEMQPVLRELLLACL
ncbi:MAG: N-formylglutamate deformylase [Pseudomonadota bacterium]|nr:N-formylglutamate deformylase [Pseudomonadota bacterium]